MDEERLIEVVQLNTCLWDPGSNDYSNRTLKDKTWIEIGHILSAPAIECKIKWKKLKDARSAAIKRKKGKSGQGYKFIKAYKYESMMSFLDGIGEDTETYSNLDSMEPDVSTQQPDLEIVTEEEEIVNDHDYSQLILQSTDTVPDNLFRQSTETVQLDEIAGTIPTSRCSTQVPIVMASTSSGRQQNERNRHRETLIRQRLASMTSSDQTSSPAPRPSPLVSPPSATGAPSRRSRAPDQAVTQAILQELQKVPEDMHTHFGMTVAEMMRTLPAEVASELRIKIFQIIHNATF